MKFVYGIVFILICNICYSQRLCCDSLKNCMYYGKILVKNIEYRDSLLNIRAKTIDVLQLRNNYLLDSLKLSNNTILKLNTIIQEKENTILYQKKKIRNIQVKNIVFLSIIVVLTIIKL